MAQCEQVPGRLFHAGEAANGNAPMLARSVNNETNLGRPCTQSCRFTTVSKKYKIIGFSQGNA